MADAGMSDCVELVPANLNSPRFVYEYGRRELELRRGFVASTLSIVDRLKFERAFDVSSLQLSETGLAYYTENPHCRQVFACNRALLGMTRPLERSDRVISAATPQSPYARRQGEAKTVEHWGQRKLLLSEIEMLTEVFSPSPIVVVYAGRVVAVFVYRALF
jgi:hypothetical protein